MSKSVDNASRDHAVVIGASMGGLVAAAALAQFFRRVTVLERDALPGEPGHRRGVPQSKHAHGLQPGGLFALEELLPGLSGELDAGGVPAGDVSDNCSWTIGGVRLARGATGVQGIGVTRPFLEHRVRTRVAALPGVSIRDGVEVLAPLTGDCGRVTGVEISSGGAGVESVDADLVVDASGKVSKLPQWLAALGYAAPEEERVECKMAYLTRRWHLAEASASTDLVTVITPSEAPHFGVMIAQEDGTHIVTLGGLLESGPSRHDDAYLDFARHLPDPVIADALVGATPVTDLQPSHFPASCRRRYDKLRRFPVGLLALGDSIAAFNPMYGQGMTVAALEALALRDNLAHGPLNARKFFARAHRIEDVAWKISTGGDLRYDEVVGRRTPDAKIMNRYLDRLCAAAQTDPTLSRQFLMVAGFIERPESFFKPSIVWRVLTGRKSRPLGPAREPVLVH
jgi:2-polyprenyl-6-methoxyphenol hydroxylase-like FAD-dependent oxidoreductase